MVCNLLNYACSQIYLSKNFNQSTVAEWLRCWANLGVTPPLSDWEVVGSNSTAGMSRLGFFIQGRNSNGFP